MAEQLVKHRRALSREKQGCWAHFPSYTSWGEEAERARRRGQVKGAASGNPPLSPAPQKAQGKEELEWFMLKEKPDWEKKLSTGHSACRCGRV